MWGPSGSFRLIEVVMGVFDMIGRRLFVLVEGHDVDKYNSLSMKLMIRLEVVVCCPVGNRFTQDAGCIL